MNKAIYLSAVGAAAMMLGASPAQARDGHAYIEADGGVLQSLDENVDFNGEDHSGTVNPTNGYDIAGAAGYDFGPVRLEGEVGYKHAGVDEVVVAPNTDTTGSGLVVGSNTVDGNIHVLSGMVNLLADFGHDDGFQVFGGGGIGGARVTDHIGPGLVDDSDGGFAWQLLAGVRFPVSDNIQLGLKYRYFNADNVNVNDTAGDLIQSDFRSHSVLA